MFRVLRRMGGVVADYTVGTVIVMAHMATVDRQTRRRLLAGQPPARRAATIH